jgi:hypothetical protein
MGAPATAQRDGNGDGQGDGFGQGALDISAITATLESLRGGQEEMKQFLASLPAGDHALNDANGLDGFEFDDGLDAHGLQDAGLDPGESFAAGDDPEALAAGLADVVGQHIAQQTEPLRQQMAAMTTDQQIRDLVAEHPEMGDPDTARAVIDASHQLTQAYGWPAELAGDPRLHRIVYAAGRAYDAANAEGDGEDPRAAHLEGGGGAGPSGAQQSGMTGMGIVNAKRVGRDALPFQ